MRWMPTLRLLRMWSHSTRVDVGDSGDKELTSSRTNNGDFDLFDDDSRIDDKRLNTSITEASDFLVDIREYDVPYHVRVMIDKGMYSHV